MCFLYCFCFLSLQYLIIIEVKGKERIACGATIFKHTILCLTSRTTVTSAFENDRDVSTWYKITRCLSCAWLLCFSRVQKGLPGLTHKWCVLQRLSYDALSDVTVILEMRQSIENFSPSVRVCTVPPLNEKDFICNKRMLCGTQWIYRDITAHMCSLHYLRNVSSCWCALYK